MSCMSAEELMEYNHLNSKVERRKLEIEIKEWKTAYEKLADHYRKNFGEITLFDVLEFINKTRPKKER